MGIAFTQDSATISTSEYSLPADTTTGVPTSQTDDAYVELELDVDALASGDEFQVKLYETTNGDQASHVLANLVGAQVAPFRASLGVLGVGWDITIIRIAGSDRSIGWKISKVT